MREDDPYRDPQLYDLEYEGLEEDLAHYIALGRRARGPVLELGVGNGRIALRLARAGVEVHGLDASEPMLRSLEAKLKAEPDAVRARVRYELGDFTRIESDHRYPLVILPFNAMHHCRTHRQLLALFDGVRGVLAPNGVFALDCYLPDPTLYDRKPGERYEERDFLHPTRRVALKSWEEGWYDKQAQIHHVVYVYEDPQGRAERVHLELRMYFPQELRALIDWAGFDVVGEACDFKGRPMHTDALKWVVLLRPRPS